jgi:hypothetical protein
LARGFGQGGVSIEKNPLERIHRRLENLSEQGHAHHSSLLYFPRHPNLDPPNVLVGFFPFIQRMAGDEAEF